MWGKTASPRPKKKRTIIIGVLALVVVLVVIAALLWNVVGNRPGIEKEAVNPPGCPQVEVLAVPGTYESAADDDPIHPHFRRNAMLLNVTNPLQQRYSAAQVRVYTVPYVAQFRNPGAIQEASYNDSRDQGQSRLVAEMNRMHKKCPATQFLLTGFSQGAVIAGDVASEIGNDRGPVPAKNVLGVALLADGRRVNDQGINPGEPLQGKGLEAALGLVGTGLGFLSGSDATMKGRRDDGFGSLNDRTYQLCSVKDIICNATMNPLMLVRKGTNFFSQNPVHGEYNTNPNVVRGMTATQWIVQWMEKLINKALA
ncbi:hypothetical protein IY73_03945 [Lawsonella clevelandensis]|uniref:cutinase family protein n=1 Tax=Lawsonella clevelandensis TaxID=1528099 RepID=UPI0006B5BA6D|nr:cutinase family protein [Lawsonella clevelandensis]ALE34622.1 hypothetical protein IY73_03945 [Lawsonella clevelandensis]